MVTCSSATFTCTGGNWGRVNKFTVFNKKAEVLFTGLIAVCHNIVDGDSLVLDKLVCKIE